MGPSQKTSLGLQSTEPLPPTLPDPAVPPVEALPAPPVPPVEALPEPPVPPFDEAPNAVPPPVALPPEPSTVTSPPHAGRARTKTMHQALIVPFYSNAAVPRRSCCE